VHLVLAVLEALELEPEQAGSAAQFGQPQDRLERAEEQQQKHALQLSGLGGGLRAGGSINQLINYHPD